MLETMIGEAATSSNLDAPFPEDVRWLQLEPGNLKVSSRRVEARAVTFARHDFSLGIKVATDVPRRKNCIAVIADHGTAARWFGASFTRRDVAVSRGALDLSTAGPSALYSVTIDADRLVLQFPHAKALPGLTQTAGDAQLTHDGPLAAQLRRCVQTVLLGYARRAAALDHFIDSTLLPLLGPVFEERATEEWPRSVTRRVAAVRLCEEYVRCNIDSNPTLYDLSRISGLRLRSLINAFQAVTGASPMAYLKRQRLNGVRQVLLVADKSQTRIIDVAANWGFWHMGHFTSDYRAMFGETPSETLLHKS